MSDILELVDAALEGASFELLHGGTNAPILVVLIDQFGTAGRRQPFERQPAVPRNRNNWLFAGSLRSGKRAAAIMSLIQSARLNGHEPHAYLKDIMERLPTQPVSRIGELLPHRWRQ